MPGAAAPLPARAHWPVVVLAAAAALIAILAHAHLFPDYSWNRDEPVYLWHMEVLRDGRLTAPDGGHPDLFLPWLSTHADGELFTQYTLGWPLVLLAARTLTGTATTALPVGAALAVAGTYALTFELTRRRRVAVLSAGLLVASPIVAIQGGVYLSYLFTLGIGLLAGTLLCSGARLGRPARHVAAGALLGLIFLTRPYDALLWAGAFGIGLLLTRPDARRATLRALAVAGAAALPFIAGALLYNRRLTGELLTFPVTAKDPLDGFGFGPRRLAPGFEPVDYTVGRALRSTAKNGVVLPWFLVGGYLTVVVAAIGAWRRRHDGPARVLLLVAAAFPVGYFVFWGTFLSSLASRISGPIYLVPLFPVVCALAALALDDWWSRRRALAIGTLVALGLATLPGAITRFQDNREISVQQAPWRTSVDDVREPAVVFVANTGSLLYANPFASNPPDLDGPVLYASAGSPSMLDLIDEQPARTPYLQQPSVPAPDLGPREDPLDLDVTVTPITVVRGEVLRLTVTVSPTGAEPIELSASTGADEVRRRVSPTGGPVTVELLVGGDRDGALAPGERGSLVVVLGTEDGPRVRRITPYRVVDGVVEAVTPVGGERELIYPGGKREWRHAIDITELQVALAPAG